jgi:hypothetical protein
MPAELRRQTDNSPVVSELRFINSELSEFEILIDAVTVEPP